MRVCDYCVRFHRYTIECLRNYIGDVFAGMGNLNGKVQKLVDLKLDVCFLVRAKNHPQILILHQLHHDQPWLARQAHALNLIALATITSGLNITLLE